MSTPSGVAPQVHEADFLHVPRRTLLAYGASGVPLNWLGTFLGVHLIIFYTDVAGLDPWWVAFGLFVATMWDAISDPLMGVLSDRTRWRWGRRRPYVLLGALPLGLSYFALLSPPERLSGNALGVYFTVLMLVLYTARTVVEAPLGGLAPELAQEYHQRTRLAAYREFHGNLGDLLGLLAPLVLLLVLTGDAEGEAAIAGARTAFRITGMLGALACIVGLGVTYWGTYEDPTFRRPEHIDWRTALRAIAHNRAFVIIIIATTLIGMGLAIVNGMLLYILRYVVEVDDQQLEILCFTTYIIGALSSYPFWLWYARRFGKPAAFRIGLFTSSLTFVSVFFLTAGNISLLYGIMVFAGASSVGVWMLAMSLGADVIDIDELETGLRREGVYAGCNGFVRKAATALATSCIGIGLALVHFEPNVAQTPEAIRGLRLLFALPPTGLVLAAYFVFRRFPLTRETHHELMTHVAQRRVAMGVAHKADLTLAAETAGAADAPDA